MELIEWVAYFKVLEKEDKAKEQAEQRAKMEALKRNAMLGEKFYG
jgi:hypothetical protein